MDWKVVAVIVTVALIIISLGLISNMLFLSSTKIIWTYWNEDIMPDIITSNLQCWSRQFRPLGWKLIILHDSNLEDYITDGNDMNRLNALLVAHKADWIRLYLLQKYGGVWMDAGIIINDAKVIDDMYKKHINHNLLYSGFKSKFDNFSNKFSG